MREIKFRGWHAVKKVMFSAEEMASDQLTLLPTGQFINVSSTSTRLSEIYPQDKFIPLQYTGLKDKNGKEIYEGDIVRCRLFWNGENKEGNFVVEYGKYPSMKIAGFFPFYGTLNAYEVTPLRIIGNIYENPELLEVKV